MEQQYEVAMSKLLKYNLIVVIDKLHDPRYVEAMEQFFGVVMEEVLLMRSILLQNWAVDLLKKESRCMRKHYMLIHLILLLFQMIMALNIHTLEF